MEHRSDLKTSSNFQVVLSAVSQGSILDPLLFLFINDSTGGSGLNNAPEQFANDLKLIANASKCKLIKVQHLNNYRTKYGF